VALSYYAQFPDSRIARPKAHAKPLGTFVPRVVPPLQRPTHGLTDEFLTHVRDAYEQAILRGLAPAPELARQIAPDLPKANRPVRTIHKWVSVARQRGIMPAASRKGRAG
jgi:hypothetical protein